MNSSRIATSSLLSASVLALALLSQTAYSTPITITSQLTGDIRFVNPDDIVIDVTITSDTTWNYAEWTIDLNSVNHPSAKLGEFYFNMYGLATDYSFYNFSPTDWTVFSPATEVGGGGGISFLFESSDTVNGGPGDDGDVTNSRDLTFRMTLTGLGAFFTEDLFLDAPIEESNDAGSGQLGAHVQSLCVEPGPNCTTTSASGFAFGDYVVDDGGSPPLQIPEPGALFLMGAGLLGLGMARRRKPA